MKNKNLIIVLPHYLALSPSNLAFIWQSGVRKYNITKLWKKIL